MAITIGFLTTELFKNSSPDTQQALLLAGKKKYYKKATWLPVNVGADCNFYYILSGDVKLCKETQEGEETIVDILSAGNFFGEHGLFELAIEPYQAQAINDLQVLVWPIKIFKKLIDCDQQLLISLFKNTLLKQNELCLELEHEHLHTVEQRLGCLLIKLCETQNQSKKEIVLKLPYDKMLIAARLGMRPETFSRAMHKLCENYHITNQGNILYIQSTEPLINNICKHCSEVRHCRQFNN